jgi:acetolactate synthase-1/2/3 large subunit
MEERAAREHHSPSSQDVKAAAVVLAASKNPAIVAGGGAVSAARELTALAEMLQAPVLTSLNGKGAVDENHPLSLGSELRIARSLELLNQADVVLMVGTKVGEAELWGNKFEPKGKVIRIDRIPTQLDVNWIPDMKLVADSKQVLAELAIALKDAPKRDNVDLTKVRQEIADSVHEVSPQLVEISKLICSSIPSNSVVTGDSSQITYFGMASVFKASRPSQFLYTPTYATLGYGLSAAIGAKLADPAANVISVLGDGALMFSIQEFATAAEQQLDLTVVLIDNGGYGEIKNNEEASGINPIGVDLFQPDWVALVESFGGSGHRVTDKNQLRELVAKATAESGISLVHVPIELFD